MDEILGYFRSHRFQRNGSDLQERASESAGAVVHAVVDTVKAHPLPTALIGSGIAWLIYERTSRRHDDEHPAISRHRSSVQPMHRGRYGDDTDSEPESGYYAESESSWPGGEPTQQALFEESGHGGGEEMSARGGMRSRISESGHRFRDRGKVFAEHAREQTSALRERTRDASASVGTRARSTYRRSRDAASQHPLEVGVMALAAGVLASLLTPNPRAVDEWVGPMAEDVADRAKEKAREAMDRGRHVLHAAADTARSEAKEQGLTPEQLKARAESVAKESIGNIQEAVSETTGKARSVAEETKASAKETARHEADEMRHGTERTDETAKRSDSGFSSTI